MTEAGLDLVLRLGRGLHMYGYPAHRLEDALVAVSRRLGLVGQFFSMPTALFASFGSAGVNPASPESPRSLTDRGNGAPPDQRTFLIRVDPGEVQLARQAQLAQLAYEVADGTTGIDDASRRLDALEKAPLPYGPFATTLAFAATSGAAARFFGGGAREIAAGTAIGLATGLLALAASRVAALRRVFEPLAAAVAAALATVLAAFAGPISVHTATVAGLIVLVPGFTLTVAMIELATRNLMSGTARFAGAAGTFLAIGFGVALGTRLAVLMVGAPAAVTPLPLAGWTEAVALAVAPVGFTILLRAQPRDLGWIALAGALAYGGARLGSLWLGPELGAFVGALVLGVASNAYGRALDRPEVVPLVPGMLLLVPGSLGFSSLASLLERETLLGIESAFRMTLVAVSLSTGLLFSNLVMPARRRASEEASEGGTTVQ